MEGIGCSGIKLYWHTEILRSITSDMRTILGDRIFGNWSKMQILYVHTKLDLAKEVMFRKEMCVACLDSGLSSSLFSRLGIAYEMISKGYY